MTAVPSHVLAVLNRIFVWKYNSLAAYIVSAEPYVASEQESLMRAVARIAEEDERDAAEAARLIEAREGIPTTEPYGPEIGELNYLSLTFLGDYLRQELERQLAALEHDLSALVGWGREQAFVSALAQRTREQIERLRRQ